VLELAITEQEKGVRSRLEIKAIGEQAAADVTIDVKPPST
jgi:hypothetical protein